MPNAKKMKSGRWRIRVYAWKSADGRDVYKSFTADSKREAEFLAAEWSASRKRGSCTITVGDAIDRYISSKEGVLSPTTISKV